MFSLHQKFYHSLLISQHTNSTTHFHSLINLLFSSLYFLSSKTLNHNFLCPYLWSRICIMASFFLDLQFTVISIHFEWIHIPMCFVHCSSWTFIYFLSSFHAFLGTSMIHGKFCGTSLFQLCTEREPALPPFPFSVPLPLACSSKCSASPVSSSFYLSFLPSAVTSTPHFLFLCFCLPSAGTEGNICQE